MRKLVTEPLTWFLLFGALLFLASQHFSRAARPQIVVDRVTIEALLAQREAQELQVLDAPARQAAIDDWVADEILYREAARRELYRDERIRRALILRMRSEITGELTPPSEETLRAWFDANRDRYRQQDGQPAEYDAVRPYLQGDWLMERSRQAVDAEVARLRAGYEIVIEAG